MSRIRFKIENYTMRRENGELLMYRATYEELGIPVKKYRNYYTFPAPQTKEHRAITDLSRNLWFPMAIFKSGNEEQV